MDSKPLTPAEVAKLGGVTPAAVRRWADRGDLPCERTPSGVRIFSQDSVTKFLNERHRNRSDGRRRTDG